MAFKLNLSRQKNAPKKEKISRFIYGPVLSRRLGLSLGVDILPPKTCNLNCIYCQLGPTKKRVETRRAYFRATDIIEAVKQALENLPQPDYVTFSGSGEPTLNASLGDLIAQIKKITKTPVAVLTNSLLLTERQVRQELVAADLVIPSLDAATQDIFFQVNRPSYSASAQIDRVIEALACFRQEYSGEIWVEIMLVKEINDSLDHLLKLKEAIARIRPNRIQLNTVVRPPAEPWVLPLQETELLEARKIIGPEAEIVTEVRKKVNLHRHENLRSSILAVLRRRPASLEELTVILGESGEQVRLAIAELLDEEKIVERSHYNRLQYESKGKGKQE